VAKICPALLKKMWAYEDDPMQDELDMCLTVCDEFLAVI
jgi:speckle-type POZ protein